MLVSCMHILSTISHRDALGARSLLDSCSQEVSCHCWKDENVDNGLDQVSRAASGCRFDHSLLFEDRPCFPEEPRVTIPRFSHLDGIQCKISLE